MKKIILLFVFFLFSCGAKKKLEREITELTQKIESQKIEESNKDTISIKELLLTSENSFKISAQDPKIPSKIRINETNRTIEFQNATIEKKAVSSSLNTNILGARNQSLNEINLNKHTDLQSESEQSKSKEQFKVQLWHLLPVLALIGVLYLIINHRKIIAEFLINNLKKIFLK
jgi:ATP-dependent Zn protease